MKKLNLTFVIFYDDDGMVLFHRRADSPSHISFLGGGIEIDELPKTAIMREIQEEIGLTLDEEKNKLVYYKEYELRINEELEAIVHVFEAKFPGFEYVVESDEVKKSELELLTLEQARTLKALPVVERILFDLEGVLYQHH